MGKKKNRNRPEASRHVMPWWKRAWAKVTLIPLGTTLAILTAGAAYKSSGAEELRAQVYQPLYGDVRSAEEAVEAVSIEKPPVMQKLPELRQTGAFERIPRAVQIRVLKVSEDAQKVHTAVLAVNEMILREMSARITQIRSEEVDRVWRQSASQRLRDMSTSKKGISDSVIFSLSHSGRSRSVDIRDPARPVVTGPGGPSFVIGDWLTYPESIITIERLWTDVDYLYFNEARDAWYYQLTREDIRRANTTLTELLKPVYKALEQSQDFRFLLKDRPALLSEITDTKAMLVDRIREPKHLRDLIRR